MKEGPKDSSPTGAGEMSEAEIDANVEDSFPASDPPAWTLGSNHRPAADPEREKDDEGDEDGPESHDS